MRRSISTAKANRWIALFVVTRLAATAAAVALLLAHRVTGHDGVLIVLGLAYGALSVLAAVRWPDSQRLPAVWALDAVLALGLVLSSEQWRSPFYLLALTSLVVPASTLALKPALAWGGAFTGAYFAVALTAGIDWHTLETTARLEGFATHLMMPMLVVLALAYSGDLLRRLEKERNRSEQLVLEAERRRIALELHDSAKQRIHAAHLVLSSLGGSAPSNGTSSTIGHAMRELKAAAADLDANLSELRAPLGSGGLDTALRERAAELESAAGGPQLEVTGWSPELPSFLAAHVFHIVSEAMTNAARHADAKRIRIQLSHSDNALYVVVSDDGRGIQEASSPRHGIRSMLERAELLGGKLTISGSDEQKRGTSVCLEVPLSDARKIR